jgi:Ca2+-binding EF-hand superfamily protein
MESKTDTLYTFNAEQQGLLTGPDRQLFINCFKHYDTNGDTNMDAGEFRNLMMDIGQVKRTGADPTAEVKALLNKYDQNKDG